MKNNWITFWVDMPCFYLKIGKGRLNRDRVGHWCLEFYFEIDDRYNPRDHGNNYSYKYTGRFSIRKTLEHQEGLSFDQVKFKGFTLDLKAGKKNKYLLSADEIFEKKINKKTRFIAELTRDLVHLRMYGVLEGSSPISKEKRDKTEKRIEELTEKIILKKLDE